MVNPARQSERLERAAQQPIVPDLPAAPGIRVAMQLTPDLGKHLLGLADTLLVKPFPNSTLTRTESEIIATGVSAANNCFFCMDSHACHAAAVAEHENVEDDVRQIAEEVKTGNYESLDPRMQALMKVALNVQGLTADIEVEKNDIEAAQEAGASAGDIQHTVAIAAAFSMYNRFVEGFRAMTPGDTSVYEGRAAQIAVDGYSPSKS